MTPARSHALLLAHSYWPEHSPPQRRWQSLIPHLLGRGWLVTVVAPVAHYGFGPDADRSARGRVGRGQPGPVGETIVRVPYLTARDARLPKLVDQLVTAGGSALRTLAVRGHSVVIVTAPSLPLLASGWFAARLRRKPLVVEMRDAWPNLATEAGVLQGRAQRVINWAVATIQDRADVVVTVTEGFAETLRVRGVARVRTVRNGVRLEQTPVLDPPPLLRDRLEVLYLGNHGESQRLERLIEAAALVGPQMRLTLVGQGSQKPELQRIAASLGAPVRFLDPVYRDRVFEQYRQADSLVVSLRDDWKSFEATVPSKTYEVMAVGRHLTAVVRGEAARILQEAGVGDVVGSSAQEIAQLWRGLIADRSRLMTDGGGRAWVAAHADYADLAERYDTILREVLEDRSKRR